MCWSGVTSKHPTVIQMFFVCPLSAWPGSPSSSPAPTFQTVNCHKGCPFIICKGKKLKEYSKWLKCLCSIVSYRFCGTAPAAVSVLKQWELGRENQCDRAPASLHQAPGSHSRLHCTFVSKVGISIRLLIWCGKSRDQQRLSIKSAEEQGSRVHCGQGGGQGAGPTLWIQDYEPWWPPAVSSSPVRHQTKIVRTTTQPAPAPPPAGDLCLP